MTPNREHQENGPVHSRRRVRILTPRHLCEKPCVRTRGPGLPNEGRGSAHAPHAGVDRRPDLEPTCGNSRHWR